jgi:hypothetical protein
MPPVAKKPSAAPAQAQAAPVKSAAIAKATPAAKSATPAKNAALAAVAAAMAATAAGAATQKVVAGAQAATEEAQKPRRWIVKKTLNKFKANLRSVPDYYLPKFIQLVAAEVAPRCDGDQQLSRSETPSFHIQNALLNRFSRYLRFAGTSLKEDIILDAKAAKVLICRYLLLMHSPLF